MQINDLTNGKSNISRLVSIGCKKSKAILFIETPDGKIEEIEQKLQHWLLSDKIHDNNWFPLNGNLHYKYARFFTSLQEMLQYKSNRPNADFFEIYDDKERLMIKEGICYYRDLKPEDVSILSFDIETTTLEHNEKSKLLLISNTYRNKGKMERKLFVYDEYNDEGEMIESWTKWVREKNPSIICNHNINAFDFPYIKFIADKYEVSLNLGRDGSEVKFSKKESKFRKDGSQFYHYHKISIFGREVVDTLFLSIKYDVGRKYENYRLKNIIKQEKLEIVGRQHYDAEKIRTNYNNHLEWSKIKTYATHDADDALALYDLMIPPIFYSAQIIPRPLQQLTETAEGGKINAIMLRAYLQQKHSVPKASPPVDYEGGLSHGNPGIYSNCWSVDVASLYPSIMIQYEVYDKEKDPSGYFLELVKTLTVERLKNKKLAKETGDKYYTNLEQSQKILINSSYGFLAATGLQFNAPLKAAFITEKGREILTKAIDWSKEKGFSLTNYDTDAIMVNKPNGSSFTKDERHGLLNELNNMFPDKIRFEDNGYYPRVICVKAKNYIMQLEDGTIKYKGSAIKATTKQLALREFIKEIIQEMLDGTCCYEMVYMKYVKEILNITDITRWTSKKTVTSVVLNGTRKNETKVKDAIQGTEYTEGDKIQTYFREDGTLGLAENFDGCYDKFKLLESLYKTACGFSTVIPKETFVNFKLKRSQKLLENL